MPTLSSRPESNQQIAYVSAVCMNGGGTLFEGKVVYDRTYGEATYGCAACCAYKIVKLQYDPFDIPVAFEQGLPLTT